MINSKTLRDIELTTRRCYPNEMCGVVLKSGEFIQLTNLSETPEKEFILDSFVFAKLRSRVAYIVHSHTLKSYLHICTPSIKDIETQENWNIPFMIVGFDGSTYTPPCYLPTVRNKNFIGRPYVYGIQDCGTLIQDYYWFTFGVALKIKPIDSLALKKDWDKSIAKALKENGFTSVLIDNLGNLQKGDLLVVSIAYGIANHTVIYLGDGTVLNQAEVSQIEPLELWESKLHSVYRKSI